MNLPRAIRCEADGDCWTVVFDGTFGSKPLVIEAVEEWAAGNASGEHFVYWSGEIGFTDEADAMLCLLRFA